MHTSKRLLIPILALLAVPGCAQILGFEDVTAADNPGGADASTTIDAAPEPDAEISTLTCAEEVIDPALGTTLGNNEASSDDIQLSCGSISSNDNFLAWKAPVTDYYVFDTFGSSFDTVLGLVDGCDGDEFACNNNAGVGSDSEVVVKIEQDTEVLVVVDGFAGDSGDFSLNVERVSCPDSDLERQAFPLTLSTSGFGDDNFNECGGNGQEDRAYHWVAPSDGLYAFSVVAEGYRSIITLIDGSRCEDTQLGCNQAQEPEFESEVVRRLVADQQVSIYVDGVEGAGEFEIDVQKIEATCPGETLPQDTTVISNYEGRTMSSSCSNVQLRNTVAIPETMNDKTFKIDVPSAGLGCFGGCDIRISSTGALSAALLDGEDCSGEELQCVQGMGVDGTTISVDMDETEPRSHTLIVTDRDTFDFDGFSLRMECFLACA